MKDNAAGSIAHGNDGPENMNDNHMSKGHQRKMKRGPHMHLKSHKGNDGHAHPTHHAMNKEYGTPGGFHPEEGYQGGHDDGGYGNEECC